MQYRVYIIHTKKNDLPETEYYPRVNKQNINNKIDMLSEIISPITDEHNCLRWQLPNKQIEMTVIDNETNETVETASMSFLTA
jgi:hypothetical protein